MQGETIPKAIQVKIQPTQFILVARFRVAGDKNLYSPVLSNIADHATPSNAQGKIKINAQRIQTPIICCSVIA